MSGQDTARQPSSNRARRGAATSALLGFRCGLNLPIHSSVVGTNAAADRRAAPRLELVAQASVVSGDDTYLLTVRNISASGAFLEGRPRDNPELVPGAEIEVAISAAGPGMGDDEVINIECRGKVARVELRTAAGPGGFGITIEPKSATDQEMLEDLLAQLIALPPAERPASIG